MADSIHSYRTQLCGATWWTAGGIGEDTLISDADEVRLWDDDVPLAVVMYVPVPDDPHARGTYTITDHDMPAGSFEGHLEGWRDWRAALEFATGTDRKEWDTE